jgi:hypothetical protein
MGLGAVEFVTGGRVGVPVLEELLGSAWDEHLDAFV